MDAKYLEVSGRTYYAFEEPDFIGPKLIERPEPGTLSTVDKYNEGEIEPKFWRRQFGRVVTSRQNRFDWVFGVVLPTICFFFDPIVFRSWGSDGAIFADYKMFVYLLSGTSIMGLVTWLLWGERLKALNAPLAGLFFAGSILAGLVAIPLFPFSVIGSVFLVGILGFTPIFTSIVYLRNAVRAKNAAFTHFDQPALSYVIAITAIAGFVISWLINGAVGTPLTPGPDLFP